MPPMILSRSDDSGTTFPHRSFVNDLPPDSSFGAGGYQSIAIGNGLVGVAWEDYRYDRLSIRFAVSTDLGQTFSPSVIVDSSWVNLQQPSLFWKKGLFYIVWRAADTLDEDHIFFSYSLDNGQNFTPPVDVVTIDTNLAYHNGGSISVNDDGKVFAVWADSRYDPWSQENWHLFVAVGTANSIKGDLNLDGRLSPTDVVLEVNAVFLGQSFPAPFASADGNCDSRLSSSDISLLLLATFIGSLFPCAQAQISLEKSDFVCNLVGKGRLTMG